MDTKQQIRSNPHNAQKSTRSKTQKTRPLPDPDHRLSRALSRGRRPFFPDPPKNLQHPRLASGPVPRVTKDQDKTHAAPPFSRRRHACPEQSRRDDAQTIDHPESTMSSQLSTSQIPQGRANIPTCPIPLFLRALLSSWHEFALYKCRARSTNRPRCPRAYEALSCKTNLLCHTELRQYYAPNPREKTNPIKPNSTLTQTAILAQIPFILPRPNTTSHIRHTKYASRDTQYEIRDTTDVASGGYLMYNALSEIKGGL